MQVKILEHIRTIPNYPKEGINFYDLNSLFASEVFGIVIDELARKITSDSNFSYPTHVAGVESRGFVIGSALAQAAVENTGSVAEAKASLEAALAELDAMSA